MSPLLHRPYHKRNHSWPPFRLHNIHPKQNIDEDPFSFFISGSEDVEEYVVDYMNADIEDVPPRSRSLSPFRRHKKSPKSPNTPTTTAIRRLKKWIENMETKYLHHRRSPSPAESFSSPESEPITPPVPISPPLRGRKVIRRASRSVGNRAVRSHSGKPRVWREPSQDIYPVLEEHEDIGLGIVI